MRSGIGGDTAGLGILCHLAPVGVFLPEIGPEPMNWLAIFWAASTKPPGSPRRSKAMWVTPLASRAASWSLKSAGAVSLNWARWM